MSILSIFSASSTLFPFSHSVARRRCDRGTATEGFEFGILDDTGSFINFDLQAHNVSAFGSTYQSGSYIFAGFVQRTHVLRVLIVIDHFSEYAMVRNFEC